MNILILGGGAREHTLAWKTFQSIHCKKVFVAPGNAGTDAFAINVDIELSDFNQIGTFCLENDIHMVVVGQEAPLVNGIIDFFEKTEKLNQIRMVGPNKEAAQLEGSKAFSKAFMKKYNIPSANAMIFTKNNYDEAICFLENRSLPIVLKADGLASGKGVFIANSIAEAKEVFHKLIVDQPFGNATNKVLIEEYLQGVELSVFILTDGDNYVLLPEAKDYKRIGENNIGLNTGGMGAVSPVKFADKVFMDKVENKIIQPTINGLNLEKIKYQGFLFIGLMNVNGEPYVIEYNVRMGDPEAQVVIPRINNDLVELFEATINGNLNEHTISINKNQVVGVVMASGGYPEKYETNNPIEGLANITSNLVFHGGTTQQGYQTFTNGGRVLTVVGYSDDLAKAISNAYIGVKSISWENVYFRNDIGKDLLLLEL